MTKDQALDAVRRLAVGLPTDEDAAAARLMERLSASAHPELLRAALVEAGARAVLREMRP